MRLLLLYCLSLPLLSAGSGDARAQGIQRCTNADGVSVFTDKPCELVQARPRIRHVSPARPGRRSDPDIDPERQCPQRLSQLVDQIQQAISSGDSNRLAALYWWGGQGNQTASRLLERLEAMVQRPLVDIAPVYPAQPASRASDAQAVADPDAEILQVTPMPAARPRPVALRIVQTLGSGSTPASNVLYLRRQYGCFWVSF